MNDVGLLWGVSRLYDAPNAVALAALTGLLAYLGRRYPRLRMGNWVAAFSLLLVENLLWFVAAERGGAVNLIHSLRLMCEVSAGVMLLSYDSQPGERASRQQRLVLLNLPFLLVLQGLYGYGVRSWWWYAVCGAAALIAPVVAGWRGRSGLTLLATVWVWPVAVGCAWAATFRGAAYWPDSLVYAAAAMHVWWQLRSARIGRAVIVTSLWIWSLSLLVHPWVMLHPAFRNLAEQTWAMQKFIAAFGLLIALYENESLANERLAKSDQLTGLANRRRLEEVLEAKIGAGSVEVLLLDLNEFKQVNDRYGHAVGDELLKQVARRLEAFCNPDELLARLGGDEFVLVGPCGLLSRVASLEASVAAPMQVSSGTLRISASTGWAEFPGDAQGLGGAEAAWQVLLVADRRMYAAKTGGKQQAVRAFSLQV